jgi:hypothetical protein
MSKKRNTNASASSMQRLGIFAHKHRHKIIFCFGVAVGIAGGVLGYRFYKIYDPFVKQSVIRTSPKIRNHSCYQSIMDTAPSIIADSMEPIKGSALRTVSEHGRCEHFRKYTNGRTASLAKIAEASSKGIILEENQTLVNACTVGSKRTIAA